LTPFQREELLRARMIIDHLLNEPMLEDLPGAFRFGQLCHDTGYTPNEIRSRRRPRELVEARTKIIKTMSAEGFSIRKLCRLMNRTVWGIKHLLRKEK